MRYQLYAIIAGISFGSAGVFVRQLSAAGFNNTTILTQRSVFAAVLLAGWILMKDRSLFRVRPRDFMMIALTGIGGMMLLNYAVNLSMENLTMSFAAVLLSLFPVVVLLISVPLFGERITRRKLVCIFLALVGCALVSGFVEHLGSMPFSAFGVGCGLAAAVFYGLYSVLSKKAMEPGYQGMTVTFYCVLLIGLVLSPFADWSVLMDYAASDPLRHGGLMLLHAVCVSVLPYVLYTISLQHIEAGRASILASDEPAAAMAFGAIFYGEVPSILMLVGMALAIVSISVMCLPQRDKASPALKR